MRIDIENKILIPFIILIILSIVTMTVVSYYNGYELLLSNEIRSHQKDLNDIMIFMQSIDDEDKDVSEENFILNYLNNNNKNKLIIFNENKVLLNIGNEVSLVNDIINGSLDSKKEYILLKEYIFVFERYEKYNWILGYCIDKDYLINEVLIKEKNIILIAIISLIVSMEAAILISYNISKPIKRLVEYCDNIIDQDSFYNELEIKRKDEIGTLSKAFNNMISRLRSNTEKVIEMKKFNDIILQSIPEGIITTDQDGGLLSINDAAKDILQNKKNNNLDIEILNAIFKQLKSTLETNKKINNILIFNNLEGDNIYLDITTSLLVNNEGISQGIICNFNDISERKKFENNIEILDRLTTIGQFAAGIAHEIRNPLTGMKTSIQVLKNRLSDENTTNEKLFNGVIYEIDRINNLISGLLNFAKPRVPNYEKTDIIDVLNRTLELVRKSAKDSNIVIKLIDESENRFIYADKDQIEQIFLNIIKNSMTAINSNGEIIIILKNFLNEEGNFITIDFIDNGCGIPFKDLNKIFNPFYTTKNQGTGLGLSVVFELLKSNKGKIDIQSEENEGTKVKIKFSIYGGTKDE